MGDHAAVEAYLKHLYVRNLRPNTIAQAERILRWLAEAIGRDPATATSLQVETFLARRAHPATRAVEWSYLSGFYRWAVRFEIIEKNPMDRTVRPKTPRRRPRPMPTDDLALVLRTCPPALRPWFYLAAYCGLRACDIAPLRAEHIHWREGYLEVAVTKGGDQRFVPIPPVALLQLSPLPTEGWLFPRRNGQGHVTAHHISELTNRFLRKCGARQSFHALRHWYGTEALKAANGNLRIAQEMLGHVNINHTALYTQVTRAELSEAAARLPIAI